MSPADAWRWRASLALMLASGFAGLGYQIVWTQQCALWLGHESAAVLAVVAAFFAGLAGGALLCGPRIERSAHPVRWYAGGEAVIGLWSLALVTLMAPFSRWIVALTGVAPAPAWQWSVAFVATFLLLLPATAAMGATLPAIERVTTQLRADGRSIAAHYASNTFGAVVGVLTIAFGLVPALGLARTAEVCVVLNLLCAATALLLLPRVATVPAMLPATSGGGAALARLAFTGLLGIGYEVVAVRVLSQVAEDTVYTFALLLAVYLVGSAIGAAAYQRWRPRGGDPDRLGDRLLGALAVACLLGSASLWAAEEIKNAWLAFAGGGELAAVSAEAALALLAFALPTIVMGALFCHLSARASAAGVSFGRALGVNTLGAAAAPLVFGVLVAPAFGPKLSLLAIAAAYVAAMTRPAWRTTLPWAAAGCAAALAVLAPPLAFVDVPEGGHVVSYDEGVTAAVSVVADGDGVLRLRINNRQQEGSSATLRVDSRQALLPLLLHAAPRHALFLGLGTGVTASAAAEDPAIEVDAVELVPEVIAASHHFTHAFASGAPNPRLHLRSADARRYVRVTSQRYDVIVADNFHPARSGSGALYTVEHFQAVRDRLAVGGLFCQWLPLHQLDLATLRSIVSSFVAVYPDGWALLASNSLQTPVLGLLARRDGARFDVAALRERLARTTLPTSPAEFGIEDEFALLGSFIAGPGALARFAGGARVNSDDDPVVAYRAPRIAYAPDSLPRDRLVALLGELTIEPGELVAETGDLAWSRRLAAYWAARDRFIAAGREVRPSPDVADMLAQVRGPLREVLRTSPDFRPAYDPLLRLAQALARTDAAAARALLNELVQLQPARPEADRALRELPRSRPSPP